MHAFAGKPRKWKRREARKEHVGVFVIAERPRKEAMECINLCNRTQAMERGHVVHMIARRMGKEGMGCVPACVLTQGGRKKRVRMFASEGEKWAWCMQAEKGGRRFVTFLAHFLNDFACGKMAGKVASGGHMNCGMLHLVASTGT